MIKISVIVPTYRGRKRIKRALDSLACQSFDLDDFEVIVAINGHDDGTLELVQNWSIENRRLHLKVLRIMEKGVGLARNYAISAASGTYVTFIDDDDTVGEKYLESLYEIAAPKCIACAPIFDVAEDGADLASTLQERFVVYQNSTQRLSDVWWTMGYNAGKLVPRALIGDTRYCVELLSGEDVAFNAKVMLPSSPEIRFTEMKRQAGYFRVRSMNSVSRGDLSFNFHVEQRLAVIRKLLQIPATSELISAQKNLIRAQFGFVERYAALHPEDVSKILNAGAKYPYPSWMWKNLKGYLKPKRLVISYCFPPFADPSSTVMAKRINSKGEPVDVVYNDMSNIRTLDWSLKAVIGPYLGFETKLQAPNYFSNWSAIRKFAQDSLHAFNTNQARGRQYQELYTRVLWPGSHVAGALIKQHAVGGIYWEAEFSDPMRVDVEGKPRESEIENDSISESLVKAIDDENLSDVSIISSFDLIEASTIVLADKLIFTNEKQKELVKKGYPIDWRGVIENKACVLEQPTLTEGFYLGRNECKSLVESSDKTIRLGYFGSFYPNRGIGPLLSAINGLQPLIRNSFEVHLYVPNITEAINKVEMLGLDVKVYLHDFLDYVPFLATLSTFDVLVVVDSDTRGTFECNPFLPSKYSDYRGAYARIWGLVQPGSPLSGSRLDFMSHLDDEKAAVRILETIYEMR